MNFCPLQVSKITQLCGLVRDSFARFRCRMVQVGDDGNAIARSMLGPAANQLNSTGPYQFPGVEVRSFIHSHPSFP